MRFSACIEWLFHESGPDYAARIRSAASAGLDAVEFWGWRRHDLDTLGAAAKDTGTSIAAICAEPVGSLQLGNDADHDAFIEGIEASCVAALRLGAAALIVQSGTRVPELADERQHANVVAALSRAGRIAADDGLVLLLEPINDRVTRPGGLVCTTTAGLDLVDATGLPSVRLLYDCYHSAVMGQGFPDVIGERWPLVGHIHAADCPGRNEPGTGELDWAAALSGPIGRQYRGLIGLEYKPTRVSAASVAMALSAFGATSDSSRSQGIAPPRSRGWA
ncbi:TIM barrel protein [Devosia sp.]|jgi:hydroxypyruvate isomerase|uniref:TIM barrel protein n=1 Tax=Devosia sp. TaxID=1871048 RepID=UPI0035ADFE17